MRLLGLVILALLLAFPALFCLFCGGIFALVGALALAVWIYLGVLVWLEYCQGAPPDENP